MKDLAVKKHTQKEICHKGFCRKENFENHIKVKNLQQDKVVTARPVDGTKTSS